VSFLLYLCLLFYFFLFSLQQNWRRGQKRFCLEARGVGVDGRGRGGGEGGGQEGEMTQTIYAYINNFKKF
jgi:hypothetical protein